MQSILTDWRAIFPYARESDTELAKDFRIQPGHKTGYSPLVMERKSFVLTAMREAGVFFWEIT